LSKQATIQAFNYAKNEYTNVQRQIERQYKKTLDFIRIELSKMDLSKTFKGGRLANLKKLIDNEMIALTKGNYKIINSSRIKTFYNAYEKFWKESGLPMPKLNTDFIKSVLANPLQETKFKDALSDLTKKNASKINEIITDGLTKGDTIYDTAKIIKSTFEGYSTYQSKLIAKQETLRALTEGQLTATERLKDRGFKVVKVWVYNHNPKSPREYHQVLDEVEADEEGNFHIDSPEEGEIITEAPRMSGIASNDVGCSCSYYNRIVD